jgi:hypothetical protein
MDEKFENIQVTEFKIEYTFEEIEQVITERMGEKF